MMTTMTISGQILTHHLSGVRTLVCHIAHICCQPSQAYVLKVLSRLSGSGKVRQLK